MFQLHNFSLANQVMNDERVLLNERFHRVFIHQLMPLYSIYFILGTICQNVVTDLVDNFTLSSGSFSAGITWQTRPMQGLHVQVELCPWAEVLSTGATCSVLPIILLIGMLYSQIFASLLLQQLLFVNRILLSVCYSPVASHAGVCGKLLITVCAIFWFVCII